MVKQQVVVTGASGHIGFHVALQLIKGGYKVKLIIRKENTNTIILKNLGADILIADFKTSASYQLAFENADVLFHCASENTTDTSNEKRVLENTYELTRNVINTAVSTKVKTIIYTSSVVVLGRSARRGILITENDKVSGFESPYIKGKLLAEQYCDNLIQESNIDIRRLYPSWVMGSNDTKLTPPHKVIKDYQKNGQRFYFSGGISVASVEEVAKAHINAWLIGKTFGKYIVAGNNISFKTFFTTLSKISFKRPPFIYLPRWFMYGASLGRRMVLGKKSSIDPQYIKSVIGNYSWYTSEKAIKELNYSIPKLDTILNNAVTEVRRHILGIEKLIDKKDTRLKKIQYQQSDLLLITGFPGWLGIRMVDIFMNADGHGNNGINRQIRLLIQPEHKDVLSPSGNIEIAYGDITDKDSLKAALKGVKTVYHLAGVVYPKKISTYYKVNYEGTKNLVDSCITGGVRRILYMSSDSICGYSRYGKIFEENETSHPYKHYGKSKYLAEKYILDRTKDGQIDGTSLRGFWFFGPNIPERNQRFFRMFYQRRQIVFGNGKNYRSISHLDNIVQAFIKAEGRKETYGKWYWIGNDKPDYTVDDIYNNLARGLRVKYKPLYVPNWACEVMSITDTFISFFGRVNPTLHAAGKFHKNIAGNINAAGRDLDYLPDVDFEQIHREVRSEIT